MPTINGTANDDILTGSQLVDIINGLGGNDTLIDDQGGNDTLDGGDGDDIIRVTRTNNVDLVTMIGGAGNDRIYFTLASQQNNVINAGDGDDYIEASGRNFLLDAGAGNDRVWVRNLDGAPYPQVTLGAGQDRVGFLGSDLDFQSFIVTDFAVGNGGDRIDWGASLARLIGWDQVSNPFAGGWLHLRTEGANVIVEVHQDLTGNFVPSFVLQNVSVASLTTFNLGGYAADGSAPVDLSLTGTANADTLEGVGGNDTINGLAGNDILIGGNGNDTINGGDDDDTIDGGLGTDTLSGDAGNDIISDHYGYRGTLNGGTGNDTITVDYSLNPIIPLPQPAAPTLFQRVIDGGDGDDRITVIGYGEAGGGERRTSQVAITGGIGNDIIDVKATLASIDAGDGNDTVIIRRAVYTDVNNATIALGAGQDSLTVTDFAANKPYSTILVTDFQTGAGGDVFDLFTMLNNTYSSWTHEGSPFGHGIRLIQSGSDTLFQIGRTGGSYETFLTFQNRLVTDFTADNFGGYSPDGTVIPDGQVLNGTPGADTINGGGGADTISGLAGNDILTGGFDIDHLLGGDDNDRLDGGGGSDTLDGGDGNDILIDTLDGNDTLNGGNGNDTLDGGRDNDTLNGGDGDDIITDSIGGNDNASGGAGNDTITLTNKTIFDTGSTVDGGDGDDIITVAVRTATIFGGAGNDIIYAVNETIDAGDGDDQIFGTSGTITVGAGNDVIHVTAGGGGSETVTLGAGRDTVIIENKQVSVTIDDFVVGEEGDRLDLTIWGANPFGQGGPLIIAQIGADTKINWSGNGTVYLLKNVLAVDLSTYNLGVPTGFFAPTAHNFAGTASDDTFFGADASDTISGAGGNDSLFGAGGNDTINGNAGSDFLNGGTGTDVMRGGADNDTYLVDNADDLTLEAVGEGRDVVYASVNYFLAAGSEVEVLSVSSLSATTTLAMVGNAFGQEMYGNAGDNFLEGGGGNDYLVGGGGNDTYVVTGPSELVYEAVGGGSRDVVYTRSSYILGAGQEVEVLSTVDQSATASIQLLGNEFGQEIYGNAGSNFLEGGGGTDYLVGRVGDDTYIVNDNTAIVIESAGEGRDIVYARGSYTLLAGQSIEVLSSVSNSAAVAMDLKGNDLSNEIYANNGVNVIDGGAGNDFLMGFGGADTFAFTTALGATNVDQILDFVSGSDKIGLDDAVFAGIGGLGALNANAFFAGTAAHDADDRIIYDSATGNLYFDADGNGAGVQILFANLSGHPAIAASDFTVI